MMFAMSKNSTASIEIQRYLKRNKLSQQRFAELLKVTQPNVNHWVAGRQPVSPFTAWQMHVISNGDIRLEKVCPHMPWSEIRRGA